MNEWPKFVVVKPEIAEEYGGKHHYIWIYKSENDIGRALHISTGELSDSYGSLRTLLLGGGMLATREQAEEIIDSQKQAEYTLEEKING